MEAEVIDLSARRSIESCARPNRFASGRPTLAFRRYRFADLVRLLALEGLSRATQVDRLRLLFRNGRIPAPLNSRVWAGKLVEGDKAISAASVWDAADVDAHLHQPGPTTPAPAALPPRPAGLRDAMLQNARRLAGLAG